MDVKGKAVLTTSHDDTAPASFQMRIPDDAAAIVSLSKMGWGSRRIASELGISRNTVKRYISAEGYVPYDSSSRGSVLDDCHQFVKDRFIAHQGNCDVVRQELEERLGVSVSLRTVERATAHLRAELRAKAEATIRFETSPGKQCQIDFGETKVYWSEEAGQPFCGHLVLFAPELRNGASHPAPVLVVHWS